MLLHPEMGFPEAEQRAVARWPAGGVSPPGTPLRQIKTRAQPPGGSADGEKDEDPRCPSVTTPTAREARISEQLRCPPAPRKRRPRPSRCQHSGGVEFFSCPPDLEAVFVRRPERAL